jgi:hypothetical protein
MMKRILVGVLVVSMAMLAGCGGGSEADLTVDAAKKPGFTPGPSTPITDEGVVPTAYPGNFVSSDDDQVCYDMSALGYIGEVTSEMRGFKIDPPVDYNDGYVDVTIYDAGRRLSWEALNGSSILAFIVKGASNYNLYDYVGSGFNADGNLGVPGGKHQISHYNVCYTIDPPMDYQGCTPGYWRNHADRWVGVTPAADFDATFGVDLFTPDVTLGWAIWASGGGNNALARHATAALLNAYAKADGSLDQFVNYPYTVAQVIQMVQDAVADDTIEATKDLFETANELGCPLSGTRAVDVVY